MQFGQTINDFHHPHTIKLENSMNSSAGAKQVGGWSPYEFNAGTVAAVCGRDCVVIAADTRVSRGYSILSRNFSKVHKLNDNCYLLTAGMIADTQALRSKLDEIIDGYEYKMFRKPHLHPLASMLSKTLYSKRFFPYYTFNLLAGLTPEGEPRVYGYDAIGSFDYQRYGVQGSGQQLMVGLLDNQFQQYHQEHKNIPATAEEITAILVDAFQSAAERDIYTGDSVEVVILRHGVEPEKKSFKIRSD